MILLKLCVPGLNSFSAKGVGGIGGSGSERLVSDGENGDPQGRYPADEKHHNSDIDVIGKSPKPCLDQKKCGRPGDEIGQDDPPGETFIQEIIFEGESGAKSKGSAAYSQLGRFLVESFNRKLRDELLNREIFVTVINIRVILGRWRLRYNWIRPSFSLEYRSQASEAILTEKLSLGVGH